MTKPPEIVEVDASSEDICCDGGEYYGHPRVYLTLDATGRVECYYCGRQFVDPSADASSADDPSTNEEKRA